MSRVILKKISIHAEIAIGDRIFAGLKEIDDEVDVATTISSAVDGFLEDDIIAREGLHVAKIWERYPCFDFEDSLYENRKYQNFYFSMEEFTAQRVMDIVKRSRRGIDAQLVNEDMPPEFAPAIYYRGEGEWMYLAIPTD